MVERMHRTQILLQPAQRRALGEIAQAQGRTVSDFVREIIQQALDQREQQEDAELKRDLAALERIREHRNQILAENGGKPLDFDVVEAINQAREEQDARNFTVIFGCRD